MKYILQSGILLAAVVTSPACGADRMQLAQNVQPTPVNPLPGITSTVTTCMTTCDIQTMSCLNACVPVGPVVAPNPAGAAPCTLSCVNSQLVCKSNCR